MTDLSLDEVKRMSELSRGVAMEVTQPSCLFFFTFVFVGYYYEEEENVSLARFLTYDASSFTSSSS